jgi:ANTAR domain/GAF domain
MTIGPLSALFEPAGAEAVDTLSYVTHAVADCIPSVDYASISVIDGAGELSTVGATDPLALKADSLQYELNEGPTASAVAGRAPVQSADVAQDFRWPRYGARVAELGLRGQTALLLQSGDRPLGALNMYSASAGVLRGEELLIAQAHAARAASGMLLSRRLETFSAATRTRGIINQAVGLVMERYSLDSQRAFDYLVNVSRSSNVKLPHVASEVVASAS